MQAIGIQVAVSSFWKKGPDFQEMSCLNTIAWNIVSESILAKFRDD